MNTNIIRLKEVDSTNDFLCHHSDCGDNDIVVVTAEYQTNGRGQGTNHWESEDGANLLFSILVRPHGVDASHQFVLSMAHALALREALGGYVAGISLKWPNDVYWRDYKISGTLIETALSGKSVRQCIFGTGINVNIAEEDFPEDLRDKATSLSQLKGEEIPRVAFFRAVLEHMDALYDSILREGFAEVFSMWRRYSITLGQMVRVIDARGGKDAFTGRAVDIDEDGALLVDTAEGRRRVLAGDVSIRPQQD